MTLREYSKTDCATLARLFHDTVHTVNAKDYTQEQLDAWATGEVNLEAWNKSFQAHHTVVAEMDGQIVGFGDMDDAGYLDRIYVHKDYQRRGVATAICDALEQETKATELTTHASITARPFFEKRGYTVVVEQQVERRGVWLTNFVMKKKWRKTEMTNEKVFAMSFAKVYPMLIAKAERKGRTRDEVLAVTAWLTGYTNEQLEELLDSEITYGDFFRNAPAMNPARKQIKGSVCGVKVETIEDPLMQEIRILDKLVDELAKGKAMDKILRHEADSGADC